MFDPEEESFFLKKAEGAKDESIVCPLRNLNFLFKSNFPALFEEIVPRN